MDFLSKIPIVRDIADQVFDKEGIKQLFDERANGGKDSPLPLGTPPQSVNENDVKAMVGSRSFPFFVTCSNRTGGVHTERINNMQMLIRSMNSALDASVMVRQQRERSPTYEILSDQQGNTG